jgi:hypothetical protein
VLEKNDNRRQISALRGMLNFSTVTNFTPGKSFSFHPSYFEVTQAEAATG